MAYTTNSPDVNVDSGTIDIATIAAGDNVIGRVKITDGSTVASVRDLTNSNPIDICIVDGAGDQITSFGGGTQYTEGDNDPTPTGTVAMWRNATDDIVSISEDNPLPVVGEVTVGGTVTVVGTVSVNEPVSIDDNGGSITVDGTVAVSSLPAIPAGTNNIGDVDVLTLPSIPAGNNNIGDVDIASIAAGDNNIGNVDVVTLPAIPAGNNNIGDVDIASIAAGDNNIGNVDIVTLPSIPAGTNNIGDVDVLTLPALPTGTNTIGSIKITDGTTVATVRDLGTNDAMNVAICDASGNQITSFGGGTSSAASSNNSSAVLLSGGGTFTGVGESVLAYGAVTISIRASHASATDGVSIEWSNDNTNWDRTEKWDYIADKPFSVCLRPKGEFFRVVYTNGATLQTTFRLETLLHANAPRNEGFINNGRVIVDGISYKIKWIKVNATASGDNTVIALVSGKKLRILHIHFTCSTNVDIIFKSGSNTLIDAASFAKYGGISDNSQDAGYFVETNSGEAFIMNLSGTANVRGRVYYVEI